MPFRSGRPGPVEATSSVQRVRPSWLEALTEGWPGVGANHRMSGVAGWYDRGGAVDVDDPCL